MTTIVIISAVDICGRKKILLSTLKAGEVGHNLDHIKNVFMLANWWNPAKILQAKDRAVRINHEGKVNLVSYDCRTLGKKHMRSVFKKKEAWERFLFQDGAISIEEGFKQFCKILLYEYVKSTLNQTKDLDQLKQQSKKLKKDYIPKMRTHAEKDSLLPIEIKMISLLYKESNADLEETVAVGSKPEALAPSWQIPILFSKKDETIPTSNTTDQKYIILRNWP